MTYKEMYKDLSSQVLREFISTTIFDLDKEANSIVKKEIHFNKEDIFQWAIDDANASIEYYSKRLEYLKRKQAINAIMKMLLWEEYDVSDYVECDKPSEYYSFIGTKEEYNTLLKSLRVND